MHDIIHAGNTFHIVTDFHCHLLQQCKVRADDTQFDIIAGRAGIWFQDTQPVYPRNKHKVFPDLVNDCIGTAFTYTGDTKIQADKR